MKPIPLVLLLCLAAFFACKPSTATDKAETTRTDSLPPADGKVPVPGATCYQSIIGQDTFRLQVKIVDGRATGTLAYRFSQKDSSYGNLDGTMHGDTLFAMYTYASEARTSKREVAFLLSPSEAQEGYGSLEEKDDAMVFSSHAGLQFGSLVRMQQVPCEGQPFDGLRVGQQ